MNLKQKISACTAAALPLLAFSAYLFTATPKAHAFFDGCATSEYNSGFAPTCGDGHDSGVPAGQSGFFVFCNADQFGGGSGGGPGVCDADGSGNVCCTYGAA
jgi:hypothetical protein